MSTKKVPVTENFPFQQPVKDKDLSAPPAATKGHRYIVAATGSGDWTGHTGDIAIGNGSGWDFVTKAEGLITWIEDENLYYYFDGSNWIVSNPFNKTISGEIIGLTDKPTPLDADVALIESVADTNAKRKLTWLNIKNTLKTYFDGIYKATFAYTAEDVANKENTTIDTSTTKYPTVNLLKTGIDARVKNDGTVNPTNLLSNGDFENWSAGTSVAPDGWTADLNGGSVARESSIVKLGSYSVKLTSPQNNDAGLVYDIGQVKGMAYWRGRSVTVGIWIKSSNFGADNGFIVTSDLPRIYLTPYITADEWTFISATWKVESDATNLKLRIHAAYGYGVAYFDGAMCVEGESIFAFSEGITPIPLGTAAAVLTANKGPAGCTAVTGWIAINIGGVQRFIPYW